MRSKVYNGVPSLAKGCSLSGGGGGGEVACRSRR